MFLLTLGAPSSSLAQRIEFAPVSSGSSAELPARRVARAAEQESTADDEPVVAHDSSSALDADEESSPVPEGDEPRPLLANDLPGGSGKSAVTPQAISLPAGEGSISGMGESFTPNLSAGTITFSVPVAVPAGRAGVQPTLGLAYSSAGGNGSVGFGWSLGVPFISRQTDKGLPRYLDGPDGRWHEQEDRFIYNGGTELVPVDSAHLGLIGGGSVPLELRGFQEYRTRIEGAFMRFFRSPDGLRWVVQSKDGMRFDFGVLPLGSGPSSAVDGSIAAVQSELPAGQGRIFAWYLTRMSDAHGSPVYYGYSEHAGERYVSDVHYTSPASCAGAPAEQLACNAPLSAYGRRVHLVYEDRTDVFDSYTTTWKTSVARRLRRIEISAREPNTDGRTLVRRYHLRYAPASFYSLLSEVQVEGRPDALDPTTGVYVGNRSVSETDLDDATVGRLMPPMIFRYSEVARPTTSIVSGFGGLDGSVHDAPSSPVHSVDEDRADFFDVNSDGLPDLIVTDGARFRTEDGAPGVGVFFNGFSGNDARPGVAGGFSGAVPIAVPAGLSSVLNLANLNVVPMDIDGDGRSDLLHMPRQASYGYFTPTLAQPQAGLPLASPALQGWRFSHVAVALPNGATDPRIDFGRDSQFIRAVDVNNDGLIDVVKTTGTNMQTWLNLGYVKAADGTTGDGRFGSATYGDTGYQLSTAPIESCVLHAARPVDFADRETRLADMNGDGLQDIVQISSNGVRYWPGRGPGLWGEGDSECAPGTSADGRDVVMGTPPEEINVVLDGVVLEDVNSDGAADVVQVRYDAVDVWLNEAGHGFTSRIILERTPYAPSYDRRVRFLDIDGSGTSDLVYGNADRYQWIDFMGGRRPRVLVEIQNGLGAQTSIEYESSVHDYLADLADAEACSDSSCEAFTWSHVRGVCDQKIEAAGGGCAYRSGGSPVLSTVVRAVEVSDQLPEASADGAPLVTRTEYAYHDGYYEGIEQEFRGFGAAEQRSVGDAGQPTSITRTYFNQGRRPNQVASDRLADNPNESLKGQTYLSETFDETGVYLSSAHSTLTVREIMKGLNDVAIAFAFVSRSDEVRYDTAPFTPGAGEVLTWLDSDNYPHSDLPSIVREQAGDDLTEVIALPPDPLEPNRAVRLRGLDYAHIASSVDLVDNAGNARQQTAYGRVADPVNEIPNESIVTTSLPVLRDPERWIWRTAETYLQGAGELERYNHAISSYNASGDLTSVMQRVTFAADVPAYEFAGDGFGAQAYTQAAQDVLASTGHDSWGNALRSCVGADVSATGADPSGCLRYSAIGYDAAFSQFPLTEAIATGRVASVFTLLTTSALWDHGLGMLTTVTGPNALTTRVQFDGLGRLTSVSPPRVAGCGSSQVPTERYDYELFAAGMPVHVVNKTAELACTALGANAERSRDYVDGLGRTRATLLQAEDAAMPAVATRWHRSGVRTLYARGAVRESYQADFLAMQSGGTAPDAALAVPTTTPSALATYDAFGRVLSETAEDGSVARTAYHALSTDSYDPLDLDPSSPHYGTPATTRSDGHGRTIDVVERNRQLGQSTLEYYRLISTYRADGKMVAIVRAQTTTDSSSTPVGFRATGRTFVYDSQGRRLGSSDPDTNNLTQPAARSSWRYLYNRAGDLAAVRDPRGCGQNFYYDLAGRLIGEDHVRCTEAQAVEAPVEQVPGGALGFAPLGAAQNVDVRFYFDAYPPWFTAGDGFPALPAGISGPLDRATGASDRGQRSVFGYDDRGNLTWTARQLAMMPNAGWVALTVSGEPPAVTTSDTIALGSVTFDTAHTYVRSASFDHAGRPYAMTLPRDPDDAGAPTVGGVVGFNARGLPRTVSLTLGATTLPIVGRIDYTRDGLVERVEYGDTRGGTRSPTVKQIAYDLRRRPIRAFTTRVPTAPPDNVVRPLGAVASMADQTFVWDRANNLTDVSDNRNGAEWPSGFRPQTTHVQHDALYRVADVALTYTQDSGARTSSEGYVDHRSRVAAVSNADPMRPRTAPRVTPAPSGRPVSLTYEYDWLANMVESTDDANQFYERSLGRVINGANEIQGRPSALRLASDLPTVSPTTGSPPGGRGGYVETSYGGGGNLISFTVHAQCADNGATRCWDDAANSTTTRITNLHARCVCAAEQHYQYRWDELNRLAEARRYDRSTGTGSWALVARHRAKYDASNQRTVKHVIDPDPADGPPAIEPNPSTERAALYVYPGDFERRGLVRDFSVSPRYAASAGWDTETQYLVGGARVVWPGSAPTVPLGALNHDVHINVPIGDLLGTTTGVIDLVSGALVEANTYLPTGGHETYRAPDSLNVGPEPSGFTGKEADDAVGVTYFGERWLAPQLGRWLSPDPAHIHAMGGGEALNSYHYVTGNLLQARDPLGLAPDDAGDAACWGTYAILGGLRVSGQPIIGILSPNALLDYVVAANNIKPRTVERRAVEGTLMKLHAFRGTVGEFIATQDLMETDRYLSTPRAGLTDVRIAQSARQHRLQVTGSPAGELDHVFGGLWRGAPKANEYSFDFEITVVGFSRMSPFDNAKPNPRQIGSLRTQLHHVVVGGTLKETSIDLGRTTLTLRFEATIASSFKFIYERAQKVAAEQRSFGIHHSDDRVFLLIDRAAWNKLNVQQQMKISSTLRGSGVMLVDNLITRTNSTTWAIQKGIQVLDLAGQVNDSSAKGEK